MDLEIAAVMTIKSKLALLEKLLDRRIMRASVDTVSPALPLLEKVYTLGEYKRLAANLAVMEHRISCELYDEEKESIICGALNKCGMSLESKRVKYALKKARGVLIKLGIDADDLRAYKKLPLFRAECVRISKIQLNRETDKAKKENLGESAILFPNASECAWNRSDRTVQAL